jgi:acetolactate synthase-1/2/3 large subunit/N2-(2-carboxyethyl)arginine synthase
VQGSELFLHALRSQGVTHAFGIMGREAEALAFNAVPGIRFCLTRHEFSAGIMADVFARLTGRMQLCFATFGPGLTNLSTGIASAMLDRAPMLAVAAQIEQQDVAFNHCHQCIDNLAVIRPIAKYASEFTAPLAIPRLVAAATTAANTELLGPSFLSFPIDVMQEHVPDDAALAELDTHRGARGEHPPHPDRESVRELARMIARSRSPIAIVGNSVLREGATADLAAFVDKFGVPIVSTFASKGALSDRHTFGVGAINRYVDSMVAPLTSRLFGESDLVVLIGYDLSEDVKPRLWHQPGKDVTVALITPVANPVPDLVRAHHTVVGSVKSVLAALNAADVPATSRSAPPIVGEIRALRRKAAEEHIPAAGTVAPEMIVMAARKALGPDGILVSDIGLHKQFAGLFSETTSPNTFLCSNGLGSFGFGIAAALGAQLACPERRVVAICGDGGFLSNSQELETMMRLGLPVVLIVLRDGGFGLIKLYQLRGKGSVDDPSVDFLHTDFEKLAQAHGCAAMTIDSPRGLERALADALERREPLLVQIPVKYNYSI